MLDSQANWIFTYNDRNGVDTGSLENINASPVITQLLLQRGIDTEEKANRFLYPDIKQLHDPGKLSHIEKAVKRVRQAITEGESILVYGDYDADGVTSTAVMVEALRESGAMCDFYIPNRFSEGYGPNEEAFRLAHNQGFQLIITVDNGIAGIEEIKVANELGIDVIVTDHHEPQDVFPEAYAIIHPKCSADYPFKDLAGVGVAFKFAEYLLGYFPENLLDLVVIGTIADLVPLQGENRILAYFGLEALKTSKRKGIQALKEVCHIEGNVTEEDIGFRIGPRLNAVGRLQDADMAVELLLTEELEEAKELAEYVENLNKERKKIVTKITEEAHEILEGNANDDKVLIVAKEGWNQGVLGIVASKLVQTYYRPAVVLAIDSETNEAKGSARSIEGFDMFQNCIQHKQLFTHFGGHAQAAGMTLPSERIPELQQALNLLAGEQLSEEDYRQSLHIDGNLAVSDINLSLVEQLNQLAPYGMGNPKPLFHLEAIPSQITQIGAMKNHLKIKFTEKQSQIDSIGFGLGENYPYLAPQTAIEVVGELQINKWNGIKKPQLLMKDLAVKDWQLFDYRGKKNWYQYLPSDQDNHYFLSFQGVQRTDVSVTDKETIESLPFTIDSLYLLDLPNSLEELKELLKNTRFKRLFVCFQTNGSHFFDSLPTRDDFKWLYQLLRKRKYFNYKKDAPKLSQYKGWKLEKIKLMFQVFYELEFVAKQDENIVPTPNPAKKDLTEAEVYQKQKKMIELEEILIYSSYTQLKNWLSEQINEMKPEEAMINGL